ncbi:hypothetical protein V6N13_102315 [Hibiscus sabdariffa]|uniref:Uncharacterized protein n=1 Tax=Hibiscus sabdariffa TaxID=183260 RepID=A0ABR2D3Q1_9ROSI
MNSSKSRTQESLSQWTWKSMMLKLKVGYKKERELGKEMRLAEEREGRGGDWWFVAVAGAGAGADGKFKFSKRKRGFR